MYNLYAHGSFIRPVTLRHSEGLSKEVAELKLMYYICKRLTADIKLDILSQCTYFKQGIAT